MARKHLRQLLVEDQEPFLLDSYISDRRLQLNIPPTPLLHHPKSTSFRHGFLINSIFSPLPPRFDAVSLRARPNTAENNTVLLRVPQITAALLLEAALRIDNFGSKDCDPLDGKKQGKSGAGTWTVESLFRKFSKFGRRSRKKEFGISEGNDGVLVRDILRLDNFGHRKYLGKVSTKKKSNTSKKKSSYVGNCPCSASEQTETPRGGRESAGDSEVSNPKRSPFRYPTSELRSLAVSPTRSVLKDKVNYEEKDQREIQPEEVEKEQSSPVSVLDPPSYNNDDDEDNVWEHGQTDDHDNDEHKYAYGLDNEATSYTITKQQLLRKKLYRFERFTWLDPVELEERMMEQDDIDEDEDGGDSGAEVVRKMTRSTRGTKKLVSDLVVGDDHGGGSAELVVDIDNIVIKGCFRQHRMSRRRKRDEEEHRLKEIAAEIEVSILGILVEELTEEFVSQEDSFDLFE